MCILRSTYIYIYFFFSYSLSRAHDHYVRIQMAKCTNKVQEQRRKTESSVRRTCEAVGNELNRQIQVRENYDKFLNETRICVCMISLQ